MENKGNLILMIIALSFIIIGSWYNYHNNIDLVNLEEDDTYIEKTVSCNSNSMGRTIGCKDVLYKVEFLENNFITGRIYTYRRLDGGSTAHRLVYDCRKGGCDGNLIFIGDANIKAEIVKPYQVEYIVKSVSYK